MPFRTLILLALLTVAGCSLPRVPIRQTFEKRTTFEVGGTRIRSLSHIDGTVIAKQWRRVRPAAGLVIDSRPDGPTSGEDLEAFRARLVSAVTDVDRKEEERERNRGQPPQSSDAPKTHALASLRRRGRLLVAGCWFLAGSQRWLWSRRETTRNQ